MLAQVVIVQLSWLNARMCYKPFLMSLFLNGCIQIFRFSLSEELHLKVFLHSLKFSRNRRTIKVS